MVFEELFKDGPVFARESGVFSIGTDAVALCDFADTSAAQNILDIGCGSGVLSVVAAMRGKKAAVTAVDIQPEACALAEENVRANGLEGRIKVINADIKNCRKMFVSGSFDYIISNPPYFPPDSGKHSESVRTARQEVKLNLYELIEAVNYLLKYGGYFSLVHRADRSAEVITALSKSGLEPKVMRFVQHSVETAPSVILIKCKKGGKPGVTVPAPLILDDGTGKKSEEAQQIWEKRWLNK